MTELTAAVREKGFVVLRDEETGEFDQEKYPSYRWRYWQVPVPPPDFALLMSTMSGEAAEGEEKEKSSNAGLLAGPLQVIGKVWGNALKELHVEVSWGDSAKPSRYELATQLIAQDAVAQLQMALGSMTSGGGGTP
jgi:hypothetical protein